MSLLHRILRTFHKDQLDRDLDDELRFHAEQRARDLNIPLDEAHARLGNTHRLKQQSRDVQLALWLESILHDLRLALRIWRKHPVLASAAILTIALGAGLNTSAFEVVYNVLLAPLPYHDPARLHQVWLATTTEERNPIPTEFLDRWRDSTATFTHLAAYRQWRVTITGATEPTQVPVAMISANFFSTLGIPLASGREFKANEDNAILLRESFARARFPRRASYLDETLTVDGALYRVIGIVPDSFLAAPLVQLARGGASSRNASLEPDAFLPLSHARDPLSNTRRLSFFTFGRLQPGLTTTLAANDLQTLAGPKLKDRLWLAPFNTELTARYRPALTALFGATLCVLLISCANLANLLLAQTLLRQRELALRAALGAGRARILRQLLTEALFLSTLGGLLGLAASRLLTSLMIGLYPEAIPRLSNPATHPAIYTFALAITLSIGLLIGTLPAWRATKGGYASLGHTSHRWSSGLVAFQVALTTLIFIAAGLLLNSFFALRSLDPGIATERILTTSLQLPPTRYPTRDDRARFAAQWLDRLQTLHGIDSVGLSNSLPLGYTTLLTLRIRIPGATEEIGIGARAVTGDYFHTMGMRFLAGRPFDPVKKGEIVINEAFAAKYLSGQTAIGTLLPQGKNAMQIVGLVKDVRHLGLKQPAIPELFLPYADFPMNPLDTALRTSMTAAQLQPLLRKELEAMDSQIPLGRLVTMHELVDGELARISHQVDKGCRSGSIRGGPEFWKISKIDFCLFSYICAQGLPFKIPLVRFFFSDCQRSGGLLDQQRRARCACRKTSCHG